MVARKRQVDSLTWRGGKGRGGGQGKEEVVSSCLDLVQIVHVVSEAEFECDTAFEFRF